MSDGFTQLEENMKEYIKTLSNTPLFANIKERDLNSILKCIGGYLSSYDKGEFISLAEEPLVCVGLVLKGTVHMLKEDFWGNKSILTIIKKNQLFGESFICGSSYISTVSFFAASDLDILFLPFERVIRSCTMACAHHHRLIENMMTSIAKKNMQFMEKFEIVSKRTLREKILAFLSQEAQKQKGQYVTLNMGRQEIADYLCVNRSALARELSNMKADGLIDYDKNMFQIL